MKKNKIIALLALSVLVAGAAHAKAKEKIARIGSANGEGRPFSGLSAIAKENGFFEEEFAKIGYKVEYFTFQNGIAVNEALIAKDIDFSVIGDVPAITGFRNDIGVAWIASNTSATHLTIAVRKNSGIKNPEDLIGKSIGLNLGTNAQQLFENYITAHNLPREKLNVLNLTLANSTNALVTGDLDVAIGNSTTFLPLIARNEVEELYSSTQNADWSAQSLVTARKAFLKNNPEAGSAYLRALFRADQELKNNPDKNYNIASGKTLDNNPELGSVLFSPASFNPQVSAQAITKLQILYEILKSVGRVSGSFDVGTVVDNSYYEKVAKEWQKKNSKITIATKK
ncbi:MAG: ABC transporter substrate-binding protein [Treponema sp.]|nr:ABC transporter substrate-binding protein [Treponema sp.]